MASVSTWRNENAVKGNITSIDAETSFDQMKQV